MELLPCGFKLWCHESATNFRSLEYRGILADGVANQFLALVVTRRNLIALHTKHLEVEVNVKLLHLLKGVFAKVSYRLLPHVTYFLWLFPPMSHVDDFRGHHCPSVNIVDIVGVAFKVNTAAVHVKVQRTGLGIGVKSTDVHWVAEIGLHFLLHALGDESEGVHCF